MEDKRINGNRDVLDNLLTKDGWLPLGDIWWDEH